MQPDPSSQVGLYTLQQLNFPNLVLYVSIDGLVEFYCLFLVLSYRLHKGKALRRAAR